MHEKEAVTRIAEGIAKAILKGSTPEQIEELLRAKKPWRPGRFPVRDALERLLKENKQ